MPRHFGALIPSTNTTGELEYSRLLPEGWQAHYARMATSSVNKTPFSPPRDEDLDYQAKMLGTAKVEIVFLLQTSASLFSDGYCEDVSRRIDFAHVHGLPIRKRACGCGCRAARGGGIHGKASLRLSISAIFAASSSTVMRPFMMRLFETDSMRRSA